ncbi:MAG: hypothetical protein AAF799_22300 [Myxococcota bacterium]
MRSRARARLDEDVREPGLRPLVIVVTRLLPLLGVLLATLWPHRAMAAPVIPAGQEARIQSLFAPLGLGERVTDACTLRNIAIEPSRIVVGVQLDDDREARMELDPPADLFGGDRDLPSFAVSFEGDDEPQLRRCLTAVRDAAADNDDGQFWQSIAVAPGSNEVQRAKQGDTNGDTKGEAVSSQPAEQRRIRDSLSLLTRPWGDDGLFRFGLMVLVLAVVLVATTRRDGTRPAALLAATSLGAWGVRAWLSPAVAMAPWPYSRVIAPAQSTMGSSLLSSLFPDGIALTSLVFGSVWAFALLAPVAVYLHGRYLLADPKRALGAAFILAALPLHIRFSQTDTAFIPSITTTALVFVLIHIVTREKQDWARMSALVLLPGAMTMMFEIRPLNIMYMPLMLGTCVVRGWSDLDKRWVVAAAGLVSVVTFGIGVPTLLDGFANEVDEGLSFAVLVRSLGVLFDWEYNILLNPMFTPTGVLALAGFGGWSLVRGGERRVLAFLVLWLMMFLVAHAYIVPVSPAMQARYHLHLVTPFVMLAGCGLAALPPGRWRTAILAYIVVAPLIHSSFITDTGYNDMREFQFVQRTAALVPDDCTVLEYSGQLPSDARYQRMTTTVHEGKQKARVVSAPTHDSGVTEGASDPLVPEVRALVERPPQCTYLYVGLACEGLKAPDDDLHPACEAMLNGLEWELVAEERTPSRLYDGHYRPGYASGHPDHAHFRLLRVTGSKRP